MAQLSNVEYKALLRLNERIGILVDLVNEYKGEQSDLKTCLRLIKNERKRTVGSKASIPPETLQAMVWRYDDFLSITKRLIKTNDAPVYSRACADLDALHEKITSDLRSIQIQLDAKSAQAAIESISDKVNDGARKVGAAVGNAIDKLKKTMRGENSG